jgi:acyl-CoA reductase-like NAD-dependent aldehyde dehydrogenase
LETVHQLLLCKTNIIKKTDCVCLGLEAKNPAIILPDADLDLAIQNVLQEVCPSMDNVVPL